MRIAVLAALAMLLGGCARSGETGQGAGLTGADTGGVIGDERGGKMHYGPGGLSAAMGAATAHCQRFGKKAMITQMAPAPDGSGQLAFDCRGTAS